MSEAMPDEDEKLEKVRQFLSNTLCDFLLIYRGKIGNAGLEFKWCKAVSREKNTREEHDRLAAMFQEVALHSYQTKQSVILEEVLSHPNSQTKHWCGLNIPTVKNENPLPTNSVGQRWWDFVVEPVSISDVGYVVVARIAAREEKEVADCIRKIYEIMRG